MRGINSDRKDGLYGFFIAARDVFLKKKVLILIQDAEAGGAYLAAGAWSLPVPSGR